MLFVLITIYNAMIVILVNYCFADYQWSCCYKITRLFDRFLVLHTYTNYYLY